MRPSEKLALIIVLATVATVYVSAVATVFRDVRRRLAGKAAPPSRRYVWWRRIVLTLAAGGIGCAAYARFVEPYWLEEAYTRIETRKLPPQHRPLRLVHISDLHCDPKVRLEEKLPAVIGELKPDAIVFTGDATNSPGGMVHFRRCLRAMSQIAPTFAVRGNCDDGRRRHDDMFDQTGVRELNGSAVRLNVPDANVWIAGAAAGQTDAIDRAMREVPDGALTIFLHHYPDSIETLAGPKVDLLCTGHTHGGQIALPFYGAIVTLSKFGKQYEAGLYNVGQTHLYVNRGIGMEADPAPRMRFCARPEVALIEIHPDQ